MQLDYVQLDILFPMSIPENAINCVIYGFEHSYTMMLLTFKKGDKVPNEIEISGCFCGRFMYTDTQETYQYCYYIARIKPLTTAIKNLQENLLCIDPTNGQIAICGQKIYNIKSEDVVGVSSAQIRNIVGNINIYFRYNKVLSLENFGISIDSSIVLAAHYKNAAGTGQQNFVIEHKPDKSIVKKCLYYAERTQATTIVIRLNTSISCIQSIKFRGKIMDLHFFKHNYKEGTSTLVCRHGPQKIQSRFVNYTTVINPN